MLPSRILSYRDFPVLPSDGRFYRYDPGRAGRAPHALAAPPKKKKAARRESKAKLQKAEPLQVHLYQRCAEGAVRDLRVQTEEEEETEAREQQRQETPSQEEEGCEEESKGEAAKVELS